MAHRKHALTREDAGLPHMVGVGDEVRVTLPETATTGFTWRAEVDESVLRLEKDELRVSREPRGAPGTRVFTFQALSLGKVSLRLAKRRSWEREPKEEIRFEIEVVRG